ncbi:MAG TPA: alpha/beta fold hydrolase [Gaiellaceae bacterium]|nr:alpha/beta fold hydrolase [Gaiellaceae bacterium]
MSSESTRSVALADGRPLEVHELGDPGGFPIVYHHGTPGSGTLYARWATPGVRLIAYDRAGYGGSARMHGRAVVDVVADITAVADALGLERFATWGLSGGGPHVLACAALCDERLVAAATLAGVGPWNAEGLDWLAGMGKGNLEEFDLILAGEEALLPAIERDRDNLLGVTPAELREAMAPHLSPTDSAALTAELAEYLHANIAHAIADSGDGWIDDNLAFVKPWGFELSSIARPVLVLQGGDDLMVPRQHGEWLAANVPGCESRIEDAHGHLTLAEHLVPEVHAWLQSHS